MMICNTQSGAAKAGSTTEQTSTTSQAATAYAALTRGTFRRFSSIQKDAMRVHASARSDSSSDAYEPPPPNRWIS